MKKYFTTSLFTVSVFVCFAQNIKNLSVIPSIPTSTNNVKIFTHVEFTSNAIPVSITTLQAGNVIDLNRCYSLGVLTVMDQVKDTLHLGTLAPGVYTVNYNGAITNSNSTCSPPAQTFTSSLTFTVLSTPSGIAKYSVSNASKVYPNPFKDKIMININSSEMVGIKLFDGLGNVVAYKANYLSNEVIELSELTKGFYILEISQTNKVHTHLRIIKN